MINHILGRNWYKPFFLKSGSLEMSEGYSISNFSLVKRKRSIELLKSRTFWLFSSKFDILLKCCRLCENTEKDNKIKLQRRKKCSR